MSESKMKPNKDKVRVMGYVQSYGEGLVPLYRILTDEYGDRWRFEKHYLQLEKDRDALVEWQNRAIDRLIMWLEGRDEIDFITHAHRLLEELCNCENELPPCSICYRIGEATRK